jgi:AcrR family transcriptional regulator
MHIVKDYDERREEFLDTAQRLFSQRSYEETTVAAIIDAVGVSKGAFYHYFATKEDLLDGIADRNAAMALAIMAPVLEDGTKDAIAKLNAVFALSTGFKVTNRELIITLLKVLYDDRNLRLRKRIERKSLEASAPVIATILRSGRDEGVFDVEDADEAAALVLRLGGSLVERIADEALAAAASGEREGPAMKRILGAMRSYTRAIERIIGAPAGSLRVIDEDIVGILAGKGAV